VGWRSKMVKPGIPSTSRGVGLVAPCQGSWNVQTACLVANEATYSRLSACEVMTFICCQS